jgi:hypothetical protein
VTRAAAYSQDLYDTMRRVLAAHRLDVRGRRVVLKPNLVVFEPGSAINTHPMLSRRGPAIAGRRSTWRTPPDTSRRFRSSKTFSPT